MKKIIILIYLFIVFLIHPTIPVNQINNNDKDIDVILKDLKSLPYSGVPGDLLVFGENASVVLTNSKKTPVIALAKYGKGKAVALSHDCYFSNEIINKKEGKILIKNLLNLSSIKEKKILCVSLYELSKYLNGQFDNVISADSIPRKIDQFDIIFIKFPYTYENKVRDKNVKKLEEYIKNGGILISTAIGWVYNSYGEGTKGIPLKEFYANKLFVKMGIIWEGSYVTDKNNEYLIEKSKPHEAHFLNIINKSIKKINSGHISSNFKESKGELDQLYRALGKIPDINYILTKNQIQAIMSKFKTITDDIIPSKSNPITINDIEATHLITYANVIMKKTDTYTHYPGIEDIFPGKVNKINEITKELTVSTKTPYWKSTGLYAPAGKIITIEIPDNFINLGLGVQIGSHSDKIYHKDSWIRWPDLINHKLITQSITKIHNPHGGLIYITVPNKKIEKKDIKIKINGAVMSPYYNLGTTNLSDWKKMIESTEAPWGEIASDKIIITVPTKSLKKLKDPVKVLKWWDKVIDSMHELTKRKKKFHPYRFVCDIEISAGYMHSGYPIMTYMDVKETVLGIDGTLFKEGNWGYFHELGHNNQSTHWTFLGTREVTVNLFTLFAMEKNIGIKPHEHPMITKNYEKADEYLRSKTSTFKEWQSDPWIAIIMYVQLQKKFGWDPFKNVFEEYSLSKKDELPKNDQEKRDQWMVRFSKEIGYNLGPFFKMWKVPISQSALDSISKLPVWTPDK